MRRVITACIHCGSQELGLRSRLGTCVCRECKGRGTPLEFNDEASWRAFVEALQPGV